jgi:hypothetical protein
MSAREITKKLQSKKFQNEHNDAEWNSKLDEFLKKSVLGNYFNFDNVSVEVQSFAMKKCGIEKKNMTSFSNEKCRVRWFFLHAKVSG